MAKSKIGTTDKLDTPQISQAIEALISMYKVQRGSFERRWYDNNFFDDGLHFRFISRKTGKIIDQSTGASLVTPKRAIPKASRQIRGIANLLLSLDLHPAVYPEKIAVANFKPPTEQVGADGQSQLISDPQYLEALKVAKQTAQRIGHWNEEEWKTQEMNDKLTLMAILAAKHSISYLQVWPDAVREAIRTQVYDAFDIYLNGTLNEIYDSPAIIKAVPMLISEIKANEIYDEEQRMKINPDNRFASSEVKQAYMQSRHSAGMIQDSQATVILKESFIKEYVNEHNKDRIRKSPEGESILEEKKEGDIVIRHAFSTSNGWLRDEYTNLKEYPFVDFRYEPGMIYQVPLIERFMPANKSLDVVMSRVEAYSNTMVTGIYQKRKGENFRVSNIPGGQMIEYETVPVTQMQIAPMPGFIFQYMDRLNQIIEEQGASTSALNQLPKGVKSGIAIESIKASEFANLKIPIDRYKKAVKNITERFIELAANHFIEPQEVLKLEQGEPDYFDIIGEAGVKAREEAQLPVPADTVIIGKNIRVNIEVESGLGFTIQGKKETMQQVANYMLQLSEVGMVSKGQIQIMLKRFLEIFQFGSTQEFMDAIDQGQQNDINEEQIAQMKIAILETMRDAGLVGEEADQKAIDTTKVGVAEVAKELNA